jgi:hypothetical protein
MAERRGGAGRALAGIIEQPVPHDVEEAEPVVAEPARVAEAEGKSAKKTRKVSKVSSKRPGVTGRTMYLHDELYALIVAKAIKRKETVSEFGTWVFESHFGVKDVGTRKRKATDPAETDAA